MEVELVLKEWIPDYNDIWPELSYKKYFKKIEKGVKYVVIGD